VHAANLDGRGYAFPYDGVGQPGGTDLSGRVYDGSPQLLAVTVRRKACSYEDEEEEGGAFWRGGVPVEITMQK
jgi:hypothetical protein